MSRKWPQDESRDVAARVVAVRQRLTGELRKPITAPCGSLTHLVPTQAPLPGTQLRFFQCTRRRSRAATWVSLMTPQLNAAEV
jgi:hypothetical protein